MDRLGVLRADLALSLDVLFHLTEQAVFETHLRHPFDSAERHVIIDGRDTDTRTATVGYVRDRRFTPWIAANRPSWRLVERIPNRYPFDGDVTTTSACGFFVHARDGRPRPASRGRG